MAMLPRNNYCQLPSLRGVFCAAKPTKQSRRGIHADQCVVVVIPIALCCLSSIVDSDLREIDGAGGGVFELGQVLAEDEFHDAGGAVAVLAHHDLSHVLAQA